LGIENILQRWDLFSHFTEPQLAQMAQCASRQAFPAGAKVVKEGEATREIYLIESGGIRIQRKTPYGLFSLAILQPGTLFGETSFVDGLPRSGDAVTTASSELLALDPGALSDLMEQDQRFKLALYWALWKSLSGKLRQTNQNLTHFFSEAGRPPNSTTAAAGPAAGEFRVDLADKRKLFQEQRLSSMEINFLASLSKERKYAPNQVIFREGEMGNEMFVILEGRVMISKYIPGAGEEALAFLERGGYFGEMALIDHEPRSADAKADEKGAVVLTIPREVVEGILDIHKISSIRLLSILCNLVAGRLRELDEKVVGWFIIAGGSGISWPVPQK
jgi:CRP/FNR family transcriptional regulator, cyclic AMP receptor protein